MRRNNNGIKLVILSGAILVAANNAGVLSKARKPTTSGRTYTYLNYCSLVTSGGSNCTLLNQEATSTLITSDGSNCTWLNQEATSTLIKSKDMAAPN